MFWCNLNKFKIPKRPPIAQNSLINSTPTNHLWSFTSRNANLVDITFMSYPINFKWHFTERWPFVCFLILISARRLSKKFTQPRKATQTIKNISWYSCLIEFSCVCDYSSQWLTSYTIGTLRLWANRSDFCLAMETSNLRTIESITRTGRSGNIVKKIELFDLMRCN